MNEDKLLTIVVPTYNMQEYLMKCLDSLVLPPKYAESLEVLVINDGSKDRSLEIAHSFERNYPYIFRVVDKENGNYGSCVNRGLAEAKGRYIKILDADDWFDKDGLLQILSCLGCLTNADLILTDFMTVNQEGKILSVQTFDLTPYQVFDFQSYDNPSISFAMHATTYRTQFLKDIHYNQTEGISHTDVEWVYLPMFAVQKCIYFPINIYRYLYGRDGQTMDLKVMTRAVEDHISIAKRIMTFYDNLMSVSICSSKKVNREIACLSRVIYKLCLLEQDKATYNKHVLREYDDFLRSHKPMIYESLEEGIKLNGFPFRYVRFWHHFGFRFPLSIFRDIARKIRYS